MANIKLRQSQLSETQSVGSTVKASTLTYQDLDDNFNNLNNALMAPVFGDVAATGILTVDTINPYSTNLTLNNIRIDSLEASGNDQGYALYNMVGSPATAQLRPNECVSLRYPTVSGTDTVTLDDYRANYHLIRWSGTAGADVLTVELPDPDPTGLNTSETTILKRFMVIIYYGSSLNASDSIVWSPLGASTLKWPGDVTPTPKFSSSDVDIYEFIQIDNVTLGSVWGFAGSTGPEGISEASYYDTVNF